MPIPFFAAVLFTILYYMTAAGKSQTQNTARRAAKSPLSEIFLKSFPRSVDNAGASVYNKENRRCGEVARRGTFTESFRGWKGSSGAAREWTAEGGREQE